MLLKQCTGEIFINKVKRCGKWGDLSQGKWQPTPVSLPGKSQGRGCLVGCSLWGRTELDMTEATSQQQQAKGGKVSVT